MDNIIQSSLEQLSVLLPAGIAILLVLRKQKILYVNALQNAPKRPISLASYDLFGALFLMIFMQALAPNFLILVGFDVRDLKNFTSTQHAGAILITQLLTQLPIIAYLGFRLRTTPEGWRKIGLIPQKPSREIATGLLGFLVTVPLTLLIGTIITLLAFLTLQIKPPLLGHEMLKLLVASDSQVATLMFYFSAACLAPIFEEIIFRGLIQTSLCETFTSSTRWGLLFVSAFIFTTVHIGAASWQALPSLFLFGLILGWLYEKTGRLLPSIIAHASFNLFNLQLAIWLQ